MVKKAQKLVNIVCERPLKVARSQKVISQDLNEVRSPSIFVKNSAHPTGYFPELSEKGFYFKRYSRLKGQNPSHSNSKYPNAQNFQTHVMRSSLKSFETAIWIIFLRDGTKLKGPSEI